MSVLASTSDAMPFHPGHVFAGRYRLVDRLGTGGVREVWRADDLVLEVPVALRLVHATVEAGRHRILEEVRLARRITHPAVCRVFDVGETEHGIYYSMELVEGESLATLLRRVGRFPFERVIEIGYQLCEGLAIAHAQGVLHRDLTPDNILVDEDGAVRLTNFEFAEMRESEPQNDLYDVGALLYELLVGFPPFEDRLVASGSPTRPSTLLPDIPPALERVVLQALNPDPRKRPASAEAMAASLLLDAPPPPAVETMWRRHLGRLRLAAVAIVMAAALGALFSLLPARSRPLSEQDTIVLADFLNTTGDPVFDGALKVALAVALEQSPFLRVFPDNRVVETLRLMQRQPGERLTRALGREVARREQLKALVAGSIGTLGSRFVLALEAINANSGDVVAREQIEVPAKEEVLTALGAMTARLREKLGESLASVEKFDASLPEATTSSLEALHAYSLALDEGRMVHRVEAIPHLQRAIALDPNFAMAQALLSGVYANTNQSAAAPAHSRRAFELRDRVSERERYFISWRYYVDAAQAWDQALDLARSWTTTYPREAFAFNSLGIASAAFGEHEQAVPAFREAIRLDARFVPPHGNLAGSLIALGRFAEAEAMLAEADQRGIRFLSARRMSYLLAFAAGDLPAMAGALQQVRDSPEAMSASIWEARASAFAGRFRNAHDLFQRGVEMAGGAGQIELSAQWLAEDAESHAIAGECPNAGPEARAAAQSSRDNFTLERAARTLALCGSAGEASRLSTELAGRFPEAALTVRIQRPVVAAAAALQGGDSARALELLDPIRPYDYAPAAELWPPYLRGQAHLRGGDGRAAMAQFESVLGHRGAAVTSPLFPLSYLGRARAAVLVGNIPEARRSYDAFFSAWSGADSAPPALEEARAEYARLR